MNSVSLAHAPASELGRFIRSGRESLCLVRARLVELRDELAELSFTLDRRGQAEASDVAARISARLAELQSELSGPASPEGLPDVYRDRSC